jgi:hypothetical protein
MFPLLFSLHLEALTLAQPQASDGGHASPHQIRQCFFSASTNAGFNCFEEPPHYTVVFVSLYDASLVNRTNRQFVCPSAFIRIFSTKFKDD